MQDVESAEHKHEYSIVRRYTSFTPDMRNVKTKWLLDDCSFICVLPTDLKKHNANTLCASNFFRHVKWTLRAKLKEKFVPNKCAQSSLDM